MASIRVSIARDLETHIRAEAQKLLLGDNLTDAVNWILRAYFAGKNAEIKAEGTITQPVINSDIPADYTDLFAA